MDRQEESETRGSSLTTAEDELRVELIAYPQTKEASDIAADAVIDAAPIRVWAEPLVKLIQERTDAGKAFIDDFPHRSPNALFQRFG